MHEVTYSFSKELNTITSAMRRLHRSQLLEAQLSSSGPD
jgi:hypothetical protein